MPFVEFHPTLCDGTHGEVNSFNSFVGANILAGLLSYTERDIGTTSSGDSVALVGFTDYSGQPRVFVYPHVPIFPPPVPPIPVPFASGIHDYAIAMSEAFTLFEYSWLTLKGYLELTEIYPILQTYKGLQLSLLSLIKVTPETTD